MSDGTRGKIPKNAEPGTVWSDLKLLKQDPISKITKYYNYADDPFKRRGYKLFNKEGECLLTVVIVIR